MKEPEIITIKERKLVGMKIRTSLSEDRTVELWSTFKPRVKEISNRKNNDFYSVQIFDEVLEFDQFTPQTFFEKWAAVEIESVENLPEGFDLFTLSAGKYARFIHKGPSDTFPETSKYIFGNWLPNSEYQLDSRPHFEIMGERYQVNNPDSEEEVYIPIQLKDR